MVTGTDYGSVEKELTYNITDLPMIQIKIDSLDTGTKWALKVNTGYDFNDDITIQRDLDQTGVWTYNLRKITGWEGMRTFIVKLYAVGGQGKSFGISEFSALPVAPLLTAPEAPLDVHAASGDGLAVLSFDSPTDNGGSEIQKYTVTAWSNGVAVKSEEGTSSPITVSGLKNGTAYTFSVSATNAQGNSVASALSNEVTPSEVLPPAPDYPENLIGIAGDQTVTLNWDAVPNTVSYAVYQYEGTTAPTKPSEWNLVQSSVTSATYAVTGLTNGTSYAFAVKAANTGGESDYSSVVIATPAATKPPELSAPSAPVNLTSVPEESAISLKWDTVTNADTYSVYQYEGTSAPADSSDWRLIQASVTSASYTVTELANGTSYAFAVKAINAGGASDYSAATIAIPLAAIVPETPGGNEGTGGYGASGNNTIDTSVIKSNNGTIIIPSGRAGEVRFGEQVILSVAAGVAEQELRITIQKLLQTDNLLHNNKTLLSDVYEITKNVTGNFKKTVTLSMKFDPSLSSENQKVAIFYFDEGKSTWVEVGGSVKGNWITAEVTHFTKFAVLAVDVNKEESGQPEQPVVKFTDIAGHWGEDSIISAAGKKLITGYPDGTFKPNSPVTRAEFTVMLVNALQLKESRSDLLFTDRAKIGTWAKRAVTKAVEAGIVGGYDDGSFRPEARITRAEMASMSARALELSLDEGGTTSFADDGVIPEWAKGAVNVIHKLGIVSGRGDNKFVPNDTATRTEAVVMLLNMLEHKNN
jgi:chondroitin AC lyase